MAPDGSEIRLLLETEAGALAHCTLPVGRTSLAVRHQTVEEIWYCLGGLGEVWRAVAGGGGGRPGHGLLGILNAAGL